MPASISGYQVSGDGVRWVKGGDGFVFMKPQFFRADSETGYSCRFASTDATDICNHCIFYYPIASAGMYFATPGLHIGTHIHCYDSQNLNSGVTELVQGPGASEVSGFSTFGQQFGVSRLHSMSMVAAVLVKSMRRLLPPLIVR